MIEQNELQNLNKTSDDRSQSKNGRTTALQDSKNTKGNSSTGQWTKLLAFAGYCSTLGTAVPTGYCVGVMNSPGVFMKAWCIESLIQRYDVHLSPTGLEILWSAIVSIFLVGGAVGSFAGAILANKCGRKGSVMICAVLLFVGGLCFYFCRPWGLVELLLVGRFLVGLGSGLQTACLPMYLSEIAPLELRGTLGVFCPVGMTTGVVVSQLFSLRTVFGTETHWNIALSLYIVLVVICFAPFFLYPESPKWLHVVKGDPEEAQLQLMRLRGNLKVDDFNKEIQSMVAEASLGEESKGFLEVLKDGKLLMPLILVCVYQGGQQLSGINAIFYYSVSIFRRAGISAQAAEWANLGAGSLNLATALLGPLLMAKVNRRPLLLMSSLACCLCLLTFFIMLLFIDSVDWFGIGCIACIFLYIFFFQFGIGPIPFFIGAELFEVASRSAAMSLGSISSWSCNFIIGMTFPTLQNQWGAFVFLPFSIACFVLFLLTKLYLPETRGRDPSDVAHLMDKGFRSKIK